MLFLVFNVRQQDDKRISLVVPLTRESSSCTSTPGLMWNWRWSRFTHCWAGTFQWKRRCTRATVIQLRISCFLLYIAWSTISHKTLINVIGWWSICRVSIMDRLTWSCLSAYSRCWCSFGASYASFISSFNSFFRIHIACNLRCSNGLSTAVVWICLWVTAGIDLE